MSSGFQNLPNHTWAAPVATYADLPPGNVSGEARIVLDENAIYQWESISQTWFLIISGSSPGLQTLNGQGNSTQTFATGVSGTNFAISSSFGVHTFNIPEASSTKTGKLTSTDWSTFNDKLGPTLASGQTYIGNGSNIATASDFTEAAQDAVGAMLSSTDLQYTDSTPLLSAIKTVEFRILDDITALTTGNGKYHWVTPSQFNGRHIIGVFATIITASSSGTPTIQIHNLTNAVDILSTEITIDVGENTSDQATVSPVINPSNNLLTTGDILRIDVDVAGTGAKGLSVAVIIGI